MNQIRAFALGVSVLLISSSAMAFQATDAAPLRSRPAGGEIDVFANRDASSRQEDERDKKLRKAAAKREKELRKEAREREKDMREAQREREKDLREAMREREKDRREAERERAKDERERARRDSRLRS
ncbi:MAG TPA: hypothetical protein VFT12_04540 [Thermoanaerobaculia bacterium]|nr:hypothetical protein [Thermoanaerobaculia bacterium]